MGNREAASQVIILAAGRGTRLAPETERLPKCLLTLSDEETFLGRLIRQYRSSGMSSITVVAGYRADLVRDFLTTLGEPVTIIENRLFDRTNNMFSLALALRDNENDVVFGNADVVYHGDLLSAFLRDAPMDSIPVEIGAYLDESMKLEVDAQGRAVRIAKDVPRDGALGNTLDVYKLSAASAGRLRDIIVTRYLAAGRLGEWSELALNDLLGETPIIPWNVGGRAWVEVDTMEDLERARQLVGGEGPSAERGAAGTASDRHRR